MEFKVWNQKTGKQDHQLTRYLVIVLLCALLVFFTIKLSALSQYLLKFNQNGNLMAQRAWSYLIKASLYSIHIVINFSILLAITKSLRYSFIMATSAFLILALKVMLILFNKNVNMPMQLPSYIDVILLFFIAGYMVNSKTHK